ncbi:MAG: CRISPR-associated helicase Cas3' [Leptolyngbyaceae cyanobacterium SM1_3_5]|nr:CRISPR-associated helicase Cas3' [Leptolyngbyaceae cyanobacterium SM1_3_5]
MTTDRPIAHTPNADGNWHDLQEHLEDVATRAEAYAEKFKAGKLAFYAGLWHDLGKYNPKFQDYLKQCAAAADKQRVGSVPHAKHGARFAWEAAMPIAPIIYGHHAGLPEKEDMKSKLHDPEWQDSYHEVMQEAQQYLSHLRPTIDLNRLIGTLVKDAHGYELLTRLLFSCLIDADYLDTEEHFDAEVAKQRGSQIKAADLWSILEQEQENLLRDAKPSIVNQVRAEVYRSCVEAAKLPPGVFRLAVPTGGGKTRSGLAFALAHAAKHELDRVIVAVPYTSIIEQTVSVYRDIFGAEAVLEHHSAARADVSQEDARKRFAQARLATQNWDAPLIVTTTVQLFESLFANRTSRCRKLHNIVKSVIILDEVQTLPVGLLEPILSVLRELVDRYRVTVVLCTATQPALEGESRYLQGFEAGTVQDIIPTEQAKQHFSTLSRVTYEAPTQSWTWEQLVQDIQDHDYNQALVVLNTRKDALNVLDAVQSSLEETSGVFHLSTLLCGLHRRQVLEAVKLRLKQNQPCFLISTQVVEAGVDLDFPTVYRAIAPLDRIVQAAGRCNREGKMPNKGRVVIFEPEAGKIPPGEYRTAVDETAKRLRRENLDLTDPSIFEGYFQAIYQGIPSDKHKIQPDRAALNYPKVAEKFKLIPNDTTSVVIQYDDRVRSLLRRIEQRGLFSSDHRELQPYLVSLRNYEFQQTASYREEVAPGLWVWRGSYDSVYGIGIGDRAIDYDPTDLIH